MPVTPLLPESAFVASTPISDYAPHHLVRNARQEKRRAARKQDGPLDGLLAIAARAVGMQVTKSYVPNPRDTFFSGECSSGELNARCEPEWMLGRREPMADKTDGRVPFRHNAIDEERASHV